MTSLRPIKAGDEILNYYGPLPNSDLLRRYGYTSVKHRAHDVVEINWSTILDATKVELDLKDLELLETVGFDIPTKSVCANTFNRSIGSTPMSLKRTSSWNMIL